MNLFLLELFRYLFLFLLYFFLYRVIICILRDISRPEKKSLPLYLTVIKSECTELPENKKISLSLPFRIGKNSDNDIVIKNSYISNEHIRIFLQEEKVWIQDQGSTNGTMINEKILKTPVMLNEGDKIDLAGAVVFQFSGVKSETENGGRTG